MQNSMTPLLLPCGSQPRRRLIDSGLDRANPRDLSGIDNDNPVHIIPDQVRNPESRKR